MRRFLILFAYCQLSMYLYWSRKLDHYINARYSYLTFVSLILAFVLATTQLVIWVKNQPPAGLKRQSFLGLVGLLLPILVGFFVPTVSLDSTTVAAKGYYFPLAAGANPQLAEEDGQAIQYLKPDTSLYFTPKTYQKQMAELLDHYKDQKTVTITNDNYMALMEVIYLYPEAFEGKEISYTGFVYNDPKVADQQFLFRFGIIHCIADSGVYGLLTKGGSIRYDDNTWVQVTGTLTNTYNQALKQYLPTLTITDSSAIDQPEKPYVYRPFY